MSQNKEKNKIHNRKKAEITILNLAFCLCILFFHTSSFVRSDWEREGILFFSLLYSWRLICFAVGGFVFLASYKLFSSPAQEQYPRYLKKRLKVIFLPFILANILYYANFIAWGYFPFSLSQLLYFIFAGDLSAPFYFVIVIMQCYILLPLWQWLSQHITWYCAIPLAMLVQTVYRPLLSPGYLAIFPNHPVFFDRLFLGFLVFWVLGMYCGKHRCTFLLKIHQYRSALFLITAILASINCLLVYQVYLLDFQHPWYNLLYHLYSYFAIFTAVELTQACTPSSILEKLSSLTYPVYLYHCFIMLYVDKIYLHLFSDTTSITFLLLRMSSVTILSFLVSYFSSLLTHAISARTTKLC